MLQTDLCGIKWRKLLYTENASYASSSEPLDDPVLSSFSKCLAADILCVWRRVQAPRPPPPPQPGGGNLFGMDPMQAAAMGGGFQQQQQRPMMPPASSSAPPAATDPNSTLSLHSSKELWIFWYGEEPDLSNLVALDQLISGKFIKIFSFFSSVLFFTMN
jgi:mediator of RNA polymerase II transcription subunit 13